MRETETKTAGVRPELLARNDYFASAAGGSWRGPAGCRLDRSDFVSRIFSHRGRVGNRIVVSRGRSGLRVGLVARRAGDVCLREAGKWVKRGPLDGVIGFV